MSKLNNKIKNKIIEFITHYESNSSILINDLDMEKFINSFNWLKYKLKLTRIKEKLNYNSALYLYYLIYDYFDDLNIRESIIKWLLNEYKKEFKIKANIPIIFYLIHKTNKNQ